MQGSAFSIEGKLPVPVAECARDTQTATVERIVTQVRIIISYMSRTLTGVDGVNAFSSETFPSLFAFAARSTAA